MLNIADLFVATLIGGRIFVVVKDAASTMSTSLILALGLYIRF
ncbi:MULTISPECIES: hypothetical protein [Terrisporobacter]|uniref:Uncharacterized protein n=1 Tax=Terrisporobacter muris TaxID=2963284 RepID=A0A9X2MJ48_9FIRM|nr:MULTISPECIES: hypothetical protein [Terrisporobacter]MCR1824901.1 hypothetical protein [Terrisporobacter muris]MDU6985546.1 hypothetical protein [Terrisporobacter othiniensis]MDY3375494.1 hypothetical protein [Terrisporobacter othiniensis]